MALHDKVFHMTFSAGDLFGGEREARVVCKRESITDAPETDWMEWQACYASGAFLMPRSAMIPRLKPEVERIGRLPPFHVADHAAETGLAVVVRIRSGMVGAELTSRGMEHGKALGSGMAAPARLHGDVTDIVIVRRGGLG